MESSDKKTSDAVPASGITVGSLIKILEPFAECVIDGYVIGFSVPLTTQFFRDVWGNRLIAAGLLKELNDYYGQTTAHNDIKSLLTDKE